MGAALELKNIPDELAERISRRAALHGCTPEQEVLTLLEKALLPREILTPVEVLAEARACIEAWGDGGGYILTLGCDFPKSVPLENIMALMSLKES